MTGLAGESTGELSPVPGAPAPSGKPTKEREGGRLVVLVVVLLVLLLGGGYVAAYAVAGDKVPRGTTVAGVDIGGKTHSGAVAALEAGLAERVAEPVLVAVGSESSRLSLPNSGSASTTPPR